MHSPNDPARRKDLSPRRWHGRGYQPHFDDDSTPQSIGFHLCDSVPRFLVQRWRDESQAWCAARGLPHARAHLVQLLERFADAGHGACHLRDARVASVVERNLLQFEGERYQLVEWCIMPNHVHVLIERRAGHSLSSIVQSWKSFTAKEANRLLSRRGRFWMADYFDRFIRNEEHFSAVRTYIRENPVKAGLVARAEDWRFGSAWKGWRCGHK